MTDQKLTLRQRLDTLRTDPRIAAFSLVGPKGQVFGLVDAVISEIDSQAARIVQLELQLKGLGALKVSR